MSHERSGGDPEQAELEVTDLVEALLDGAGTQDLDRTLTGTLVGHGLALAAALWRAEDDGSWNLLCASGPVDELPETATVRAILTHGWGHDLGAGAALLSEGPLALVLGGVCEPADDVLDQIHAVLTIRLALEEGDGPVEPPSLLA